jgi:ribosomal protein S25
MIIEKAKKAEAEVKGKRGEQKKRSDRAGWDITF